MKTMTLRDELSKIYDKHQTLTPELVVKEASNPTHPLHSRFDWDDSIAACKWRLEQAGQLLRVVKLDPDPARPDNLRAFVAIKGENTPKSEYIPTEKALADPTSRAILLQQMKRDWEIFKGRWQHMAEFAEMIRDSQNGKVDR